jgi:hypothetical protein
LTADFRNASGTSLGTRTYSLDPWEFDQEDRIFRAVTGGSVDDGYIVLTTATEGARYLAYATVIDNETGDSIFIPAISVLGQEPAPVSPLLAAQTVFDGLGQIGQGDVPTVEQAIADLQANGIEQMVATVVSMVPEGIATAIPGGVRVDFGSHLVLDSGNILSGSVEGTYSNVVISGTEVSFDFVVDQQNLLWNGGYAEIDGLTGSLESEVRTGGHAAGDVAITSFRRDTKSEGVTVNGNVHFDTEICPNYPISGSLTVSKDGEDYTIEFTDACDGTFDAPNQGQTGDVSFRLTWSGTEDLDLHVTEPNGTHIFYNNEGPTSTGGQLDVDSNYPCGSSTNAVENVFWPEGSAPHGTYEFWVTIWDACSGTTTPSFTLQVLEGTSVVRTINGVMPTDGETEHYTHQY